MVNSNDPKVTLKADTPHIDMRPFGLVTRVNTKMQTKRCRAHGKARIEIMFDTGIQMYVPLGMFEAMLFELDDDVTKRDGGDYRDKPE